MLDRVLKHVADSAGCSPSLKSRQRSKHVRTEGGERLALVSVENAPGIRHPEALVR
jgi:hypothetical protein